MIWDVTIYGQNSILPLPTACVTWHSRDFLTYVMSYFEQNGSNKLQRNFMPPCWHLAFSRKAFFENDGNMYYEYWIIRSFFQWVTCTLRTVYCHGYVEECGKRHTCAPKTTYVGGHNPHSLYLYIPCDLLRVLAFSRYNIPSVQMILPTYMVQMTLW